MHRNVGQGHIAARVNGEAELVAKREINKTYADYFSWMGSAVIHAGSYVSIGRVANGGRSHSRRHNTRTNGYLQFRGQGYPLA